MPKHTARLADLGIAFATCAAFSVAILGDIAANNFDAIIASDFPRPLYALLSLNILLCATFYALNWNYSLYAWPLMLYLFFRFSGVSNQILESFLLPIALEVPEWSDLLWIAPMLAGTALLLILFLWLILLRHVMRVPRRAAWMLLFFALGTTYPSMDETATLLSEAYWPDTGNYLASPQDIRALKEAPSLRPLPDIIALIPDRYPSSRVLREAFKYNNEAFSGALADRGFIVLDDLRANYQMTLMSFMSSMNLQILKIDDAIPLTSLYTGVRQNALAQTLTRNGYEYVHLAGWAGFTMRSPLANRIYNGTHFISSHLTEFEANLLMLTPIFGAYTALAEWKMGADGHASYECRRLKRQLHYLQTMERSEKPLFVWAHIYIPHNPLTMDANGNCLPIPRGMPQFESVEAMNDKEEIKKFMSEIATYRKMFIEYMQVFNREALAIFDAQQKQSRQHERELIFLILSDEGPYPILWNAIGNKKILYERSASHVLREKFGIFGALYANQIKPADVCSLRSRVNVWRMILSNIFDIDLPPVADTAQMTSEEIKTHKGGRYLGGMRNVRDRLGAQISGGRGCGNIAHAYQ